MALGRSVSFAAIVAPGGLPAAATCSEGTRSAAPAATVPPNIAFRLTLFFSSTNIVSSPFRLVQLGADTLAIWRHLRRRGDPMRRSRCSPTPRQGVGEQCPQGTMRAGRALDGHCGASTANILCQVISANVY